MVPGEEVAAAQLWTSTWQALQVSQGEQPAEYGPVDHERLALRYRYLMTTGPEGCLVAEDEGRLVGLAVSLLRGEHFLLANLGVRPEAQGTGTGRRLLELSCRYGAGAPGGFIASSPDPRALSLYVKAGFDLWPAMKAEGRQPPGAHVPPGNPGNPGNPGGADGAPGWLRLSEGAPRDFDLVDEVDISLKGAARRDDIRFMVSSGAQLWLDDAGGYAIVAERDLSVLGAVDDGVAARLLGALLGGSIGRAVNAQWLTSHCPWAFLAAVAAGASLKAHGALMTRGTLRLASPYVPSGVFG